VPFGEFHLYQVELSPAVSSEQSMGMTQRVKDAGRSECRSVMEWIGIEPSGDIILRESVLTSYAGLTGIDINAAF